MDGINEFGVHDTIDLFCLNESECQERKATKLRLYNCITFSIFCEARATTVNTVILPLHHFALTHPNFFASARSDMPE